MATRSSALYSPSRRGLPMTFAYTQPLPRILTAATTAPLARADRMMFGRLRPFVLAARALKGFFKA